jgi:hypothetical protein
MRWECSTQQKAVNCVKHFSRIEEDHLEDVDGKVTCMKQFCRKALMEESAWKG